MPPLAHHLCSHRASFRVEIKVFCWCATELWLTHLPVLLTRTFLLPPPFLPYEVGVYIVAVGKEKQNLRFSHWRSNDGTNLFSTLGGWHPRPGAPKKSAQVFSIIHRRMQRISLQLNKWHVQTINQYINALWLSFRSRRTIFNDACVCTAHFSRRHSLLHSLFHVGSGGFCEKTSLDISFCCCPFNEVLVVIFLLANISAWVLSQTWQQDPLNSAVCFSGHKKAFALWPFFHGQIDKANEFGSKHSAFALRSDSPNLHSNTSFPTPSSSNSAFLGRFYKMVGRTSLEVSSFVMNPQPQQQDGFLHRFLSWRSNMAVFSLRVWHPRDKRTACLKLFWKKAFFSRSVCVVWPATLGDGFFHGPGGTEGYKPIKYWQITSLCMFQGQKMEGVFCPSKWWKKSLKKKALCLNLGTHWLPEKQFCWVSWCLEELLDPKIAPESAKYISYPKKVNSIQKRQKQSFSGYLGTSLGTAQGHLLWTMRYEN